MITDNTLSRVYYIAANLNQDKQVCRSLQCGESECQDSDGTLGRGGKWISQALWWWLEGKPHWCWSYLNSYIREGKCPGGGAQESGWCLSLLLMNLLSALLASLVCMLCGNDLLPDSGGNTVELPFLNSFRTCFPDFRFISHFGFLRYLMLSILNLQFSCSYNLCSL